ncbi:hypothetical protein JB92DRAFT_3050866 [Gautieria morchelliformis]|nr:hypothetical protein JB92DRAFT_3050866 [Gautieria morchelliformis]
MTRTLVCHLACAVVVSADTPYTLKSSEVPKIRKTWRRQKNRHPKATGNGYTDGRRRRGTSLARVFAPGPIP